MQAAIDAVKSGSGINRAALDHGVPPSTLKDRIGGRVVHGTKPGPASYLSGKEEKDLAVFLKDCAAVGYGKTRRDVMNIAQGVAKEKGLLRGVRISQGWWRRFLERQNTEAWRQYCSRSNGCCQSGNTGAVF